MLILRRGDRASLGKCFNSRKTNAAIEESSAWISTAEIQQAALELYRNTGYRSLREETVEVLSNKTVGSGIRRYYLEKTL